MLDKKDFGFSGLGFLLFSQWLRKFEKFLLNKLENAKDLRFP